MLRGMTLDLLQERDVKLEVEVVKKTCTFSQKIVKRINNRNGMSIHPFLEESPLYSHAETNMHLQFKVATQPNVCVSEL